MPVYEYRCDANGKTVEVQHDADVTLRTWGELCFIARLAMDQTDPFSPVKRVIRKAPAVSVATLNSELREAGFTKLVKRDEGVYENVTAIDGEERYMKRGRKKSIPHLHKKIGD